MDFPAWLSTMALYVAVGLGIVILIVVWWWVPKWEVNHLRLKVRDAKARADVEDNFRKTLSQLFGGVAVLLGAAFAYYQTQLTAKASRDLLVSQQTSKGFEQLGNPDNIIVRLGGIYALEGVMNASQEYHKPVVEALSAFIREKLPRPTGSRTGECGIPDSTETADLPRDVQAALVVLGRRRRPHDANANLARIYLRNYNLYNIDLRNANLDLSDADLSGANLTHADLSNVTLKGACLSHARLIGTDLSGANLSEAKLFGHGTKMDGADLTGADLRVADLSNADLRSTYLQGADLSTAVVSGTIFSGIFCDEKTKPPEKDPAAFSHCR
jgi:hypothetical protein